jgi:NADH-quinone oxidoreductase subunit N
VAAYYYLRVLVLMYMKEPNAEEDALPPAGPALTIAIVGSAIATLALGIFPSFVLDFATKAGLK